MYSKSNKHIKWAEMYKCYKAWVSETSTALLLNRSPKF